MLRSSRPEPSEDFVTGLAGRIHATRPARRLDRVRVAFAGALSLMVLAALASVGGLGYAAASAERFVQVAGKAAGKKEDGPSTAQNNASKNQYKTTICHRTGSEKNPFVEITVSNNALPAHAEHDDIIPAPASGCPTS